MPGTKETREEFEARIKDWKAYVGAKKTRRDASVFGSFKEDMVDAPVIDESKSALFGGCEEPAAHGTAGGLDAVQPDLEPPFQPQSHQSLFDESEGPSGASQHRPAPFWLPAEAGDRSPRQDRPAPAEEPVEHISEDKENPPNSCEADVQKLAGDTIAGSLNFKNSSLCDNTYVIKSKSEASEGHEKRDGETHCSSFKNDDSARRGSRYMNGTIPFDASQEAVGHLEAKLRLQSVQIENYKEAIRKKDDTIGLLRQEILLLQSNTNDIDYEFVRKFSERGLEIVEDLMQKPDLSDFSHELALERNTNLRLKNVISELVDKIKALQNK